MSPDEERTAHYSGRTKRVLIADDNRDWADGLAVLLEEQGYAVRTAYDGREAIEAARTFQPDIVLLDIRMPRLTGYEAARVFHRHPQSTRPILIAITTIGAIFAGSAAAESTSADACRPPDRSAAAALDSRKRQIRANKDKIVADEEYRKEHEGH
jgi:CheY-like chemotaxis protein